MELNGWRKQWRKIWDNPTIRGNPNAYTVWGWLLDHAQWEPTDVRFGGKIITLAPGQITCGSLQISRETGVRPSTVRRTLARFVSEHLIEQRTDMQCSLVTVKNWTHYQADEQGSGQRMSNELATNEQRVSTNKEEKKERSKDTYAVRHETESLYDYITELCQQGGLENKVNVRALDMQVQRHLTTGIHLRVEVRKCLAWLIDKGKKDVSTQRLTNWFEKAKEIQGREQRRQLEVREAMNNPYVKMKRSAMQEKENNGAFDIDQSVQAFEDSLPPHDGQAAV